MKRWHKITLTALALLLVIVLWRVFSGGNEEATDFVFTEVVRTDLHATVSSTGTLSAVETVEVGTQVSGQVEQVLVDYNDVIEEGQLLAIIDTETLDASVADARARVTQAEAQQAQAEAQLVEAQAQLADAQATFNRNQPLVEQGYLSQSEFQPIQTSVQTAEASVGRAQASLRSSEAQVTQARAQVTQALKNRRNAEIRAPIGGIVVERSVDAGQTVAASFNTPTLFILARNLDEMQILADVDESDIGQIEKGQAVTFNVPAYPDQTYDGTVQTVRLQPNTEQNVVTYTVVINAPNRDGHLLPGMTATVDFVTGEANDVLAVSTAALQLQATSEMMAGLSQEGAPGPGDGPPGGMGRPPTGMGMPPGGAGGFPAALPGGPPGMERPGGAISMLWFLDEDDQFQAMPVRAGLSTGALTEIEPLGPATATVKEGLRVIEQVLGGEDTSSGFSGPGGPPGGGPGGPPRM